MDHERILITVRTYPTISNQYMETVCTGGINANGEWRRLYPVPLRYTDDDKQYRTFDVVEVDVKPGNDGRGRIEASAALDVATLAPPPFPLPMMG